MEIGVRIAALVCDEYERDRLQGFLSIVYVVDDLCARKGMCLRVKRHNDIVAAEFFRRCTDREQHGQDRRKSNHHSGLPFQQIHLLISPSHLIFGRLRIPYIALCAHSRQTPNWRTRQCAWGKSADISPISELSASFRADTSLDLDTSPGQPYAAWTAKR